MSKLEQVGLVGPKTCERINKLLKEGAGKSGKVPPGLLIAPGIRKKISSMPVSLLPGQILPPGIAKKINGGEEENEVSDTTAPVIPEIEATSTTAAPSTITWVTDEKVFAFFCERL